MLEHQSLKQIATISPEQFMLHFYEDIKIPIRWNEFIQNKKLVKCLNIADRNQLGELYTVWGKDKNGSYIQNHSLQVKDNFPKNCEYKLSSFPENFLESDVILLAVPAYECCKSRYVLLDKTHRSIRLYRSEKKNFRMVIYVIEARFISQSLIDCKNCLYSQNLSS